MSCVVRDWVLGNEGKQQEHGLLFSHGFMPIISSSHTSMCILYYYYYYNRHGLYYYDRDRLYSSDLIYETKPNR